MTSNSAPERDTLAQRVTDGLRQATGSVSRLRKSNFRLVATSFAFSAAATLMVGVTAAQGPVAGAGPEGWRLACSVAAGLGFVATTLTGLGQQLKLGDKRAEVLQCVGRLKALEAALALDSRPRAEVAAEYEEVVPLFPDIVE